MNTAVWSEKSQYIQITLKTKQKAYAFSFLEHTHIEN